MILHRGIEISVSHQLQRNKLLHSHLKKLIVLCYKGDFRLLDEEIYEEFVLCHLAEKTECL